MARTPRSSSSQSSDEPELSAPGIHKHRRLQMLLERQIRSGQYRPGQKLPKHTDLMRAYGCSCGTVTKALQALVDAGLILRKRGQGTFISEKARPCQLFEPSDPAATTIGIFHGGMPTTFHPYYSALVMGYCAAAEPRGFSLKLIAAPQWHLDVAENLLRRHGIRGFITPVIRADDLDTALAQRIPCVLISDAHAQSPVARVRRDDAHGYRLALEHLAALGHTRVLFLHPHARTRFQETLARVIAELPVRGMVTAEAVVDGYDTDAGNRALAIWREQTPRATALFVTDDILLRSLIGALARTGISWPREVAVLGLGTPLTAGFLNARITLVEFDPEVIGRTAVELLVEQIERTTDAAREVLVRPEFVDRRSCDTPCL